MRYFFLVVLLSIFIPSTYSQVSSERLIRRGVSMHDKGRYSEAINYYQQALKVNPNSMSATYEMSLSYLYLNDYNNALKYSTRVINANFQPLLVDAYCVKSSALAELGKVNDAIKLLSEAIEKCGDEYLLHYNLGLSYFKNKDTKSAITHLRKAIEIDTTHSSAFLLYAYALNDANKWIQSFLSFQFFLLLEPNTDRSKEAFSEMFDIINTNLPESSPRLLQEDGVDQYKVYNAIKEYKLTSNSDEDKFAYFEKVTKKIIFILAQNQDDSRRGLLWDFFVPVYNEILTSGYVDAYCRYVSVSSIPSSLEWWSNNKNKVDKFITWFEEGQNDGSNIYFEDEEFGDDSEDEL